MKPILADLLQLLELERIEDNIFRGESRDIGGERVFGGQVLGQALTAASYTRSACGKCIRCTRISCCPAT